MKISGQTVRTPTELKVGVFRISKAERLADGSMAIDIIALKRRLDCCWQIISAPDLQHLLNILESKTFHTVEYPDPQNGEAATLTAYVGDINQAAWHRRDGVRYWRDVSISLIER